MTEYICDRCGSKHYKSDEIKLVSIPRPSFYETREKVLADLCDSCLTKLITWIRPLKQASE